MEGAMLRRFSVLMVAAVVVASAAAEPLACGDKFLRVGRSPRLRAYASVHPSAILVYAPRWSRPGIADFERMLKRAGHKPVTVMTADAMSRALGGERYGMVITSYADIAAVKREIDALTVRPAVMPVLYKPAEREAAEASAAYTCILRPDKMNQFEAMEEIDRLIDLRLKAGAKTPAR
jgi:hypothetical protein